MAVVIAEADSVSGGAVRDTACDSVGEQPDGRGGVYPDNGDACGECYGCAVRDVSREHGVCGEGDVHPEYIVHSYDTVSVYDDRVSVVK